MEVDNSEEEKIKKLMDLIDGGVTSYSIDPEFSHVSVQYHDVVFSLMINKFIGSISIRREVENSHYTQRDLGIVKNIFLSDNEEWDPVVLKNEIRALMMEERLKR